MENLRPRFALIILLAFCALLPFSSRAITLPGDVNNDNQVNITDVTELITLLINGNVTDAATITAADMNGNGQLDIADVTTLINLLINGTPAAVQKTLTVNGVSFTMIAVEGGTFTMGATAEEGNYARRNEYPAHEVTLSGYYIAQTEVTWELWLAVTGGDPSNFDGDLQSPVVDVTLFDCAKFVDKLTELTGKVFRMPTEAEWEFAARGGNGAIRYRYAGSDDIDQVAWYADNSGGTVHAVATKAPNRLGIYDMSGNVLEWCQDWYYIYNEEPQTNPVGPESGYSNVIRGGAWDYNAGACHVTYRVGKDPHEMGPNLGLRMVMNM